MRNAIVKLLEVKSIVTISLIIMLCMLTWRGTVDVDKFYLILNSVIVYYFARQQSNK